MRLLLLVLAFASMLLYAESKAQSAINDTQTRSCNYAKVFDLNSGEFLIVTEKPNPKSKIVDKLDNGMVVYICDETAEFFNIFYSKKDDKCRDLNVNGVIFNKIGLCKSGWVKKKWIDVLSG